ncbi:hypothetical protein [Stenotrophomonas sp. NPDC077659]|uniref:hypothetical protein n=1 Tax=Stenotrophomonas sp. NPDC077659 TaxID=3390694 RepID=UPI003D068518
MSITVSASTGWGWLLVGLLFSGTAAVGCTALGRFAIPSFVEKFAEAGQPLPLITQLFASSYGLAWLGPLLVVAAWLGGHARLSALVGSAVLMMATPIAMFAAYLPLFRLGTLF